MAKRAFTLLEMLVTVAIVALLAAFLLPTLTRAKFHAWNAKCKSNVHQFGIATSLYVTDHQAYPPSSTGVPILPTPDPDLPKFWWNLLNLPNNAEVVPGGSLKLGGIFRCPFQGPVKALVLGGFGPPREQEFFPLTSYAYNGWGVGSHQDGLGLGGRATLGATEIIVEPVKDSTLKAPADLIAFGDGFQRSVIYDRDGAQTIASEAVLSPWAHGYAFYSEAFKQTPTFKAHRGKFNRVFCDGHVEDENLNPTFKPTDQYLARWNVDNLPHRASLRN